MLRYTRINSANIYRDVNPLCHVLIFLILVTNIFSCRPAVKTELPQPEDSLKPIRFFYPDFKDDMGLHSLKLALERNLEYLDRVNPQTIFQYGAHNYTCQHVLESQKAFLAFITEAWGSDHFNRGIREKFRIYKATGRYNDNKVLFTGYYEPIFEGRLSPDDVFKYPIYNRPDDLVLIDLSPFSERLKGMQITARIDGNKVLPYYSRYEIEVEKVISGRGLETAWLKSPIDVAFLHIQGSGKVRLQGGELLQVGYEASNGRPYRSIGKYMLDRGYVSEEEMSMQSIRHCLSHHPEIINDVLNYNQSYIFMKALEKGPLGNIGVPLTPGRSLALDAKILPKGALAFISCKKPVIDSNGVITEWKKFSRFVINQDTGGAIKGPGRADLFWGSGSYAELAAGNQKNEGQLYILIKKP